MYQDIAVARGSTYDTLNKRMDRYNRATYDHSTREWTGIIYIIHVQSLADLL
jgi:hypothetical protein